MKRRKKIVFAGGVEPSLGFPSLIRQIIPVSTSLPDYERSIINYRALISLLMTDY